MTMKTNFILGGTILVVSLTLSGCGKGIFSKYSPDEFAVTSRTPLVLPPEYELHPPLPKGTKNTSKQESASKKALTGVETGDVSSKQEAIPSAGEEALISKAESNMNSFFVEDVEKETKRRAKAENIKIGEVTGETISGYDESLDAESEAERLGSQKTNQNSQAE